jgi:hypothetical protein
MIPVTSTNINETAVYVDTTAVHVDTMVCNPDRLTRVDISETVVRGSDMTVKSAAVETTGVETTGVEPAATEPAMPSTAVPPSACVGEIWLTEDSGAQQRSCNAHDGPHLSRSSLVIP